jgi:hypothetical protein
MLTLQEALNIVMYDNMALTYSADTMDLCPEDRSRRAWEIIMAQVETKGNRYLMYRSH